MGDRIVTALDDTPWDTSPATRKQRKELVALLDRLATQVDWPTNDTQATRTAIDHLNRARNRLGVKYVLTDVNDQEGYFNWLLHRMREEPQWPQLAAFRVEDAFGQLRKAAALMGIRVEADG